MRSKLERQRWRREGGTGHLAGDPPVVPQEKVWIVILLLRGEDSVVDAVPQGKNLY